MTYWVFGGIRTVYPSALCPWELAKSWITAYSYTGHSMSSWIENMSWYTYASPHIKISKARCSPPQSWLFPSWHVHKPHQEPHEKNLPASLCSCETASAAKFACPLPSQLSCKILKAANSRFPFWKFANSLVWLSPTLQQLYFYNYWKEVLKTSCLKHLGKLTYNTSRGVLLLFERIELTGEHIISMNHITQEK